MNDKKPVFLDLNKQPKTRKPPPRNDGSWERVIAKCDILTQLERDIRRVMKGAAR